MASERGALFELTTVRVKEALRDPTALFWTFGFPVGLAIILGLAFRTAPPRPQAVGVACAAAREACAVLQRRLARTPEIAIHEILLQPALKQLGRGKLELVLEVTAAPSAQPELVYHFDPSRSEARMARLAVEVALSAAPGARGATSASRDQPHSEPGTRYIDYLMPGIVALNLMGSGVWGLGFAIVDSRRRHLLRRLATTPMKRSHYLLSFMFSRLVFLLPEVVLLFGFGALAFDVPVRGSLAAIAVISFVGAFAFTGMGVLIAARTDSAEVAGGWANFIMMPMWLCSGVFFRYETFPEPLLPAIRALPLTALCDALRAVTNEAAPLAACAPQLAVLVVWTLGTFALALRLFRWT